MTPLRARYGAKGNRHDLLEWDGHPTILPSELLGLTDMPCGTYAPGDRWWPSVGCEPIGDWWALWWTEPDNDAPRGGMVISEVALWHLDAIGRVDDLRPVMESLSGLVAIPPTPTELLRAVAEALVSQETGRPPVALGLDTWPGIIADLWKQLWPEARRSFSARVALSPPQSGESVAPPWIFGLPVARSPEWAAHRLISVSPASNPVSRAAAWLMGDDDPTFDDVLASCNFHPSDLKGLGSVARAADRLDKMREFPEPQYALDLLRTLTVLAPDTLTAVDLKAEALLILESGLANTSASFVLSLTNLGMALPEDKLPKYAITEWVSHQIPFLPFNDASQFLEKLLPNCAEIWWQQEVRKALSERLANPDNRWAKAAIHWLGMRGCADVLKDILPTTEKVETCLLTVTSDINLSEAELKQIKSQTLKHNWSRLHAWTAAKLFSANDAFQTQREFSGDPLPGLAYLIKHLPGQVIIEETISNPDNKLIELVAQRTSKEPQLLQGLDVKDSAWRALWAEHVSAGGTHWPSNANQEVLGNGLLDAVLTGDEPPELIVKIAGDLADIAFRHSRRAELWGKLSSAGCTALLPKVADVLIKNCNAGQNIPIPEHRLAEEVANRVRKDRPSASLLATLLSWNVQLSEQEVIYWLSYQMKTEWNPTIATTIGKAVSDKRWKRAADKIYDLYKTRGI